AQGHTMLVIFRNESEFRIQRTGIWDWMTT
ncbi:MAG: hypothetical protein ACI9I0_001843, partial [Rhodoferax sp.]